MAKVFAKGEFDLEKLIQERQRKAASGGVDLVDAINKISPEIALLKVGETVEIPIKNKADLRKEVMGITAKLNNLTPKNGKWAGKSFKVVSDGEKAIYVQRGSNVKPEDQVERKRATGPRKRKPKADTAQAAGEQSPKSDEGSDQQPSTEKAEGGAIVKVHA